MHTLFHLPATVWAELLTDTAAKALTRGRAGFKMCLPYHYLLAILLIAGVACLPTKAYAQAAAQAQIQPQVKEARQDLGRLFTTPAERAKLDHLRSQNKLGETLDEAPTAPTVIEPPQQQFTHNGFVKRSSGTQTTWINQIPSQEQKIPSNIKVKQQLNKHPAVSVLLPSGKRRELKVGQSYDVSSAKVREVYEVAPAKRPENRP